MKRSRFFEEQIIGIFKEHEAGFGRRPMSQAWGQRRLDLQLEDPLRGMDVSGARRAEGGRQCGAAALTLGACVGHGAASGGVPV